jgi:O-antigen/teichoic acid export membrane protein
VTSQPPSPHHKFARDVIIVGLATGLGALSSIITIPLFTRVLGATDYGIWAQSLATSSIVLMVVGLGLPYPMTRFLPAKTDKAAIRDDVYSVLCLSLLVTLVVSAIMVIFAGPIARTFFDGATQIVRLTALVILLSSPTGIYLTFFRAFSHMKTYSLFTLIDAYGQVGIVAYLVLHGYGIEPILIGLIALKGLLLICLLLYVTRQMGTAWPRFLRTKEYLRFGLPAMPSLLSWWAVSSSDRYVIASYLGLDSVGIYSAAYGIGNILFLIISILGLVLTPTLSRLYDEEKMDELVTQISYSLKYFLMLAIPFVVGAAVLARPLLTLFSTSNMASRGNVVLPLIALSVLLCGAYGIVGQQVLLLTKKTALIGFVWVAAAALNLGLNILLVPRLGINGSAISSLMAYALILGIVSYYSFRKVRIPIDSRFIIKSLAASGLMTLVVWLISPNSRPQTVAAVVAGVVVYAIGLFLLRAIRKDEIAFFRSLLSRTGRQESDDR